MWRGGGPHDQGEVSRQESIKPETSKGGVPDKKGIIGSMYPHIKGGMAPGGGEGPHSPREKGAPRR